MNFKKFLKVLVATFCVSSMIACGSTTGSSTALESTVNNEGVAEAATDTLNSEKNTDDSTNSNTKSYSLSDMFTSRDLEVGYTEEDALTIDVSDKSGETITISDEGTYILTGTATDVQILVESEDAKIQLVLDNLNITNVDTSVIYVKSADKVFVTLADNSENTLQITDEIVVSDEYKADGVIYSKCDLTLNGEGTLNITSSKNNAVVSKDDLAITSGNYIIDAGNHGLRGKDSVRIANGNINITCKEDAIHSDNDDDEKGFVYIAGGNINISAGDDGIHAQTELIIDGGTIAITKSYEGLEGHRIIINDGDIELKASDDGLNAAGGNDSSGNGTDNPFDTDSEAYIIINGGTLHVNADGDGIDSNGDLTVNGGYITVDGPKDGANGALDFGGTGTINGGTLIAAGSSGMAQNFGSDSTQPSIYVSVTANTTGEVTVADSNGNVIFSYEPAKAYNSVVVSLPELQVGNTYTVTIGSNSTEVELTEIIYGNATGFGNFQGGPGGQGGFGGFGGGKDRNTENGEQQRPEGFDSSQMPEGFDPSQMPEGFDSSQMPEGFDPSQMPAGQNQNNQ